MAIFQAAKHLLEYRRVVLSRRTRAGDKKIGRWRPAFKGGEANIDFKMASFNIQYEVTVFSGHWTYSKDLKIARESIK